MFSWHATFNVYCSLQRPNSLITFPLAFNIFTTSLWVLPNTCKCVSRTLLFCFITSYKVFLFTSWPDIVQIKSLLWRPQLSATESWRTHPTCEDNDDYNDNDNDHTLTVRPWSRPPERVKPQGTAEECRVSVRSEIGNMINRYQWVFRVHEAM